MKLERFKDNNTKKKSIIIFTVISVLLLAGVFFYTSFAVYEDIKTFNIISGNIPDIGEALFVYHLPDGTVTTLASNVDSSLVLNETNSTCNYGVVPRWVNGQVSLDKTNATNTSSQKIRCEAYMIEPPANASLRTLATLNPNYTYTGNSDKCAQFNEDGSIINPDTEAMSDSDTPIICEAEDDYGTSYYLRGNHQDNNVKFANMCWKLIRVTGTGGIKMIYNGDVDANGKCTTTSGDHNGFTGETLSLSGNKLYGTSYTKKGSTYTLTNTSTLNWQNDASSIIGKYTCNSTSSTCSTLYAITGEYDSTQAYGVKLDQSTNYAQIGTSVFYASAASPAYVGYMFNDAYTYHSKNLSGDSNYYYYGSSFTYDSNNTKPYTLTGTLQFADISDSTNQTSLNTHHYTCFNKTGKTCQELYFVYYLYNGTRLYYIKLNGNETVSDALDKMLRNDNINVKNSHIKGVIDYWYKNNILGTTYESYLEDTVFCNDRTIANIGGWSETGTLGTLRFNAYNRKVYLKCPSKRDAFTVSDITKGNGALTYPIGLLTSAEHSLTGNYTANKTGANYWTSAPISFTYVNAFERYVYTTGNWNRNYNAVNGTYGSRPVVSLRPGTTFKTGTDGTASNPFEIE